MKSVILCAGEGSRASGYTGGRNKCLTEIPKHGVILDYSLKTALDLTGEAVVLIGHGADEVRDYVCGFAAAHFPQARVRFAEQGSRKGLCHGLLCCEPLLGGKDFLMFLGDEIVTKPAHEKMMDEFAHASTAIASCGYIRTKNIEHVRKTYSLELSGNRVMGMIEKPSHPSNDLMGTGNCLFRDAMFDRIRSYANTCTALGDQWFSFPDVLQHAIDNGETVLACEIGEDYLNFNDETDITEFLDMPLVK
jgi:dTDP-glucose pyrophosphorylase